MRTHPRRANSSSETTRIRDVYGRRTSLGHRYSSFNKSHLMLMQSRERAVLSLLQQVGMADLGGLRILDVGCGTGQWLLDLIRWGADAERVCGVDLNTDRIRRARRRLPRGIRLGVADGNKLPFKTGEFDLIIMATVVSSILDESLRRGIVAEGLRVLANDGYLLWYDMHWNNRRNSEIRGVGRGELNGLFAGYQVIWKRVTLAPPLSRIAAPFSETLHQMLELIPWLRSHTLGIVSKGVQG